MKTNRPFGFAASISLCLTLLVVTQASAQAKIPRFDWLPAAKLLPAPTGEVIRVKNVRELFEASRNVKPGGTILLADGHYLMPRYFAISTDRVTMRSASGNRHAVVIDGAKSAHGELIGFRACQGVTVADLTIQNIKYNGFKVNSDSGVHRLTIRNCVIHNIWQRGVKGVKAPQHKTHDCIVEHCLFYNDRPKLYTDDPADTPKSFQGNYVGGLDIMDAVGWIIRDNIFMGIQGRTREGRGAIFVWVRSRDCTIERNVIIDCDAGISLGNASPPQSGEIHCTGCQVRNNFIVRAPEQSIHAAFTKDCRILHNTIFDPQNRQRRSIRAIRTNEHLTIRNNLIDGPAISVARPMTVDVRGNVIQDLTGSLVDPEQGNLHLKASLPGVTNAAQRLAEVVEDFDRQRRRKSTAAGADQWKAGEKSG